MIIFCLPIQDPSSTPAFATSAPVTASGSASALHSTSFTTTSSTSTPSNGGSASPAPVSSSTSNQSDNIALGVGISIGIPAMVISFCAWWSPRHTGRHRAVSQPVRGVKSNKGRSPSLEGPSTAQGGRLGDIGNNEGEEERVNISGEPTETPQTILPSGDVREVLDRSSDLEELGP